MPLFNFSDSFASSVQKTYGDSFLDKLYFRSLGWFLFSTPMPAGRLLLIGNYPLLLPLFAHSMGWKVYVVSSSPGCSPIKPLPTTGPDGLNNTWVVTASVPELPFQNSSFDLVCVFKKSVSARLMAEVSRTLTTTGSTWVWSVPALRRTPRRSEHSHHSAGCNIGNDLAVEAIVHARPNYHRATALEFGQHRPVKLMPRLRQWAKQTLSSRGIKFTKNPGSRRDQKPNYLTKLAASIGGDAPKLKSLLLGNPDTLIAIFTGSNASYLVRIPLTRTALIRAKRNYAVLCALDKHLPQKQMTPRPIGAGKVDHLPYFCEEFCAGSTTDKQDLHTTAIIQQATEYLQSTYAAYLTTHPPDASQVRRELAKLTTRLGPYTGKNGKPLLDQCINSLTNELAVNELPMLPFHGDFKIENMLLENNRISRIIDWDLSRKSYFPFLDLIHLHTWSESNKSEQPINVVFINYWMVDKNMAVLNAALKTFGLKDNIASSLLTLYWLHHLAFRLDYQSKCQSMFWDKIAAPVLTTLLSTADNTTITRP